MCSFSRKFSYHYIKTVLVLAEVLMATMICPFLCSCGKDQYRRERITADSLWYDAERIELKAYSNDETIITSTVFDNNCNAIRAICQSYTPPTDEELMTEGFDELSCYGTDLCIFDYTGQLISKTNLLEIVAEGENKPVQLRSFGFDGDKLYVLSQQSGESIEMKLLTIDIESGSLISETVFKGDSVNNLLNVFSEKLIIVTDEIFMLCDMSGRILVFDVDGNSRVDIFTDLFEQNAGFWDAFSKENGIVQFSCTNANNSSVSVELGGETIVYEAKKYDMGDALGIGIADDGAYYSVSNMGIYKYNDKLASFEMLIPSSAFNVNLYEFYKMSVLSASGSTLFLANTNDVDPREGLIAYRLTKTESNPNAGKKTLVVGLFGDSIVPPSLGKALYSFNQFSETSYATLMLYSYKDDYFADSDSMEIARKEEASILMREIQDGNGPDVIINAFDIWEISSDKYLCNLNEYIQSDNSFLIDEYIDTVIEKAEIDGKLYQMPLQFGTMGLSSPAEYAPTNKIGYTFEEYLKVVSEANNGADCLAYEMDRSSYYSLLFTASSADYYKSESWSVYGPEYKALATYCKENVPNKCLANYDDDDFVMPDFVVGNPQVEGIGTYVRSVYAHNLELYGYPSANGNHGVMIAVKSSGAISSFSNNKDGAWDFIKEMMSYEVQCEETVYSSINLQVLKYSGDEAIKEYNSYNDKLRAMKQDKLIAMGVHIADDIDAASIDAYLCMLSKITGINRIDGQVLLITKEEIQPFYVEQKSLKDAIAIMDNRIQTYNKEN